MTPTSGNDRDGIHPKSEGWWVSVVRSYIRGTYLGLPSPVIEGSRRVTVEIRYKEWR